MRHNKVGRRLSRTASHRKATLSALCTALILHKKIRTTLAKARETRRIFEPIVTRARNSFLKENGGAAVDVHSRREVAKFIQDKDAVKVLFTEIAEKVGKRPGGYTRVMKLGQRLGDGAEMAIIELVDYNMAQDDKSRKARVSGQKKADERKKRLEGQKKAAAATEEADVVETVEAEADAVVEDAADVQAEAAVEEAPKADEAADEATEEKK
jgi:large subunit ribosomal protein L17